MEDIKSDYNLIRNNILTGIALSGTMGKYIQPRTKGAGGDAPKTRAFYARTSFVKHIINSGLGIDDEKIL